MRPNRDEPRDNLADAREAIRDYWSWEALLAQADRGEVDMSAARVKEIERDQEAFAERAKAAALVSIAESLAVIAEALRHRPPTT